MSPSMFVLSLFGVALSAGFLGSLLGLGGGLIIVPSLTLGFGIDMHLAVGASIVAVVATSSGSAVAYLRDHMSNLRVAMLLEIGTVSGALTGAYLSGYLHTKWLMILFGIVMSVSAMAMLRRGGKGHGQEVADPMADRLHLHGRFFDKSLGKEVVYRVKRSKLGMILMYFAGMLSALLGIGSGVLKVPAMDLAMGLPLKVSSATSNVMMGVTAAASAAFYFTRGNIDPFIAGPVAVGVVTGATLGSKCLGRVDNRLLRGTFISIMIFVACQMVWKGVKL